MKMKSFIKFLVPAMLISAAAVTFTACGEDDPEPEPVAGFDYTADNLVVTFTNKSLDATSYVWDFGDGETSVEENPVHTYASFGTYTVTLEATGPGGTNTTVPEDILVEKSSVVVIDGNFADWDEIASAVSYTDGEGGFLTEMKIDYDATYLYIYLKGTSEFRGFIDIYLNADADTATGAQSWIYPDGLGAEYLVEGDININDALDLFADNPADDGWCWDLSGNCGAPTPVVAQGSGLISSSLVAATGDVKEVEFTIVRSLIEGLDTEEFGIGVCDYSLVDDGDWGYYGALPQIGTETSQMYTFKFN